MAISSTVVADPSFALVYPQGLALGPAAAALDAAGIMHMAAAFPYAPADGGAPIVYLIDEGRLLNLGPRAIVERALAALAQSQRAAIVVLAEQRTRAAWLAENPHVAGWIVAPLQA